MRRIVCLLTVLLLCVGLAMPVFAAEDDFVPSITYKPEPDIVPVDDDYIGIIRDERDEIIGYIEHGCLKITPIAHVWDEKIEVAKEIEELLLFVYNALNDDSMKIPYEKHEAELDAEHMVIRDLFDIRWVCEEHREMFEKEGVTLELIFDLGVVADAEIYVMTYDEETEEWSPIVSTVNNGDGTVTCSFDELCAVEFSMPVAAAASASVETVQTASVLPWFVLMVAAALGVVAIVVVKTKKAAV